MHPADTPLTLLTLGSARLALPSGEERLGPGKPLALLTYLACSPRRTSSREHLVDLLWADLDPDKARHALRQTIWYLRQILAADGLTTHGAELALAAPIRLDRDDFLAAIGVGDLSAAVALYDGDFLEGVAVPGGIDFEHWADVERQRLRAAFLRAAETLVRRWLDAGQFSDAQSLARRARDAARTNEAAWRLLLESLLASGEQLGFALESGALLQALAQDGREPDPATRALLAQGEEYHARPGAEAALVLAPALVGRAQPFAAVITAWERVAQSGGRHLHVCAPAGLGKTRLLSDVRRRLRDQGARVLSLRANPGDRAIPYSFAGELARALAELPGAAAVSPFTAGTLVSLHPSLSGRFTAPADNSTGPEALRRRSAALGELIGVVSEEQPCAVLLDDLHWADAASRQALRPLIERLHSTRLLLLTSARPGTSLEIEGQETERIVLQPLSTPQILELLASLGQLPDEGWSHTLAPVLHDVSGGSPLLVLETLQLALDRALLQLTTGLWRCSAPEALEAQLHAGGALRLRIERLDREARGTLLLLALAGTPLRLPQLLRASRLGSDTVDAALLLLEQRGLAEHQGEAWQPAHDEIAACTESLASAEEIRSAHHCLGEMYASLPGVGRTDLARAGAHLQKGGSVVELRSAFVRYVGVARSEGDGRRLNFLAEQFLEERPAMEARELVRTMGRLNRVRYSGGHRLVAGVGLVAALALASLALRDHPSPDIVLYGEGVSETGSPVGWALPLTRERWRGTEPLREQLRPTLARSAPWLSIPANFLLKRPGREEWAGTLEVPAPDTGTNDIYLFTSSGRRTRLTFTPRDDSPMSWSPDGRWLAISTARWSPIGADDYDIALLDPETGTIRPLVRDLELESGAFWSPDGTRIGFLRRWKTRSNPEEACWVTIGHVPDSHCVTPEWGLLLDVAGWADPTHLLAIVDSAGRSMLVQLKVENGAIRTLRHETSMALPSSDGRWVVAYGEVAGEPRSMWYLFATDDTSRVMPLGASLPVTSLSRIFWGPPDSRRDLLDTLRFFEPPERADVGVPTKLTVIGRGPSGGNVSLYSPIQWSTSDSSIASIDSLGFLRPQRQGVVRVGASAGGWRNASVQIAIAGRQPELVLRERWDSTWRQRWRVAGIPEPEVVTARDGRQAFWNHGDGSYFSGAVSLDSWSAVAGLGLEVEAQTPISRAQWQAWQTSFAELGSLADLRLVGPDGQFPPAGHRDPLRQCFAGYPAGEGMTAFNRLAFAAGGAPLARGVVGPWIRAPEWYQVRIQILPDGRCGVAVNGIPVWLSEAKMQLDLPLRVALGSSSAGVRVLHGPLEVWRGVKSDIDWSAFDGRGGHPLPLAARPGRR